MHSDSQDVRVCALVLSTLAFFLFIAAEIVSQDEASAGLVKTLAAVGALGFTWIGPLTLLAGTLRSPQFQWWQPFQGGTAFVWMQAFGWTLHTMVLTAAIVVLANEHMEEWMQGEFLLLGVAGFVAQLVLNVSIGCFNETSVHEPSFWIPCNTKAIVSMLISASALTLFVAFDALGGSMRSSILLLIGGSEFVLSAVVIHIFYGCLEIPGFRLWQPFEGSRTYLLLQFLGWQLFAAAIALTMMLHHACDPTNPEVAHYRGAATATGATGIISQILLLLSLQYFNDPTPKSAQKSRKKANISRKLPHEVYVSALLCIGAIGMGSLWYASRTKNTSMPTLFLWNERILWALGFVALALAPLIANCGGARIVPNYRWWQPFLGGTKYVFLQTLGWLWYAIFLVCSLALAMNDAWFAERVGPPTLFLGCAATAAVVLSIPYFQPPQQGAYNVHPGSKDGLSAIQQGEITISILISLASLLCHVVADFMRDMLGEGTHYISLGMGMAYFVVACSISHASGRRLYKTYRIWQPFEGGNHFVLYQAIGWTLFGVQILLDALVLSLHAPSIPVGVITCVGMLAWVPYVTIASSLRSFAEPLSIAVSKPIVNSPTHCSQHPPASTWMALLCSRRDLLWPCAVSVIITVGSLVLFLFAEGVHRVSRFRQANYVLYVFGCATSVCGLVYPNWLLGPKVNRGFHFFQPFQGGMRFVTFQAAGWTLTGVAWAVASTSLFWSNVFLRSTGVAIVTGILFFAAQCLLVFSIPCFDQANSSSLVSWWPSWFRPFNAATHDLFMGPLLGIVACIAFVMVDLLALTFGPTLPVFPVTVCAVIALFSAIPLSYKLATSSIDTCRKATGSNVLFLVVSSTLWSFTLLLGGMFCFRVWAVETHRAEQPTYANPLNTNYMGTFTGSVGLIAQLVFINGSDVKGNSTAKKGRRILSFKLALFLLTLCVGSAIIVGVLFLSAHASAIAQWDLPPWRVFGLITCSVILVACACWTQRQVASSQRSVATRRKAAFQNSQLGLLQVDTECFSHISVFLSMTDLLALSKCCNCIYLLQSEKFWRRQFFQRFGSADVVESIVHPADEDRSMRTPFCPTVATPFAATSINRLEMILLALICSHRSPLIVFDSPCIKWMNKWKTLCLSKSCRFALEQCQICGKLEMLSRVASTWEDDQGCSLRVPRTWVRLCRCVNAVTLNTEVAHRACCERILSQMHVNSRSMKCSRCGCETPSSIRLPISLCELVHLTWLDFCHSNGDVGMFGNGFVVFVPLSSMTVTVIARSYSFGSPAFFVWVWFAMALCFVSNSPRLVQSLERVGDSQSIDYLAYSRLLNALGISSLLHVSWCANIWNHDSMEMIQQINFAFFLVVVTVLLVAFWRAGYYVMTIADFDPHEEDNQIDITTEPRKPGDCALCLLQICPVSAQIGQSLLQQ